MRAYAALKDGISVVKQMMRCNRCRYRTFCITYIVNRLARCDVFKNYF